MLIGVGKEWKALGIGLRPGRADLSQKLIRDYEREVRCLIIDR